jgi:hypothetical protein
MVYLEACVSVLLSSTSVVSASSITDILVTITGVSGRDLRSPRSALDSAVWFRPLLWSVVREQ